MSARVFPRTRRVDRRRAAVQPLLPLIITPLSQAGLPEAVRQQCLELLAELFNAILRAENHPLKEAADP